MGQSEILFAFVCSKGEGQGQLHIGWAEPSCY